MIDNCITQSENSVVKANSTGFFYTNQEIKLGTYIQEGNGLGQIYPEKQSKYYAEVYVSNEDIAKIKLNQLVKFEIASYPSSEYGYFEGEVSDISKDITVDQATGTAYYIVKVKCDDMELENKDGEIQTLKNGMATDRKSVV